MKEGSPTTADARAHPQAGLRSGGVREAGPGDLDRVAALWTQITQHHAGLDPLFEMRADSASELRRLLEAQARDPDAVIFVYDAGGGDLPGMVIVRIDQAPPILHEVERAEITDLGVREEARRQGIATRLVEAALDWVRMRGVERVEVQVARGNCEGQAFWKAHGFGNLMDVLHRRL